MCTMIKTFSNLAYILIEYLLAVLVNKAEEGCIDNFRLFC